MADFVLSLFVPGTIVRIGPNEVDVADVDAVKTIYTVREAFRKPVWYKHFSTLGEDNIFNASDIEFHRRHRRLLAAPIAESSLKAYSQQINERINLTIEKMREEMKTRGAADVFKWWFFMATDVIGELTFGESFRTLEHGQLANRQAQKNDYTHLLADIAVFGSIRASFPLLTSLAQIIPMPFLSEAIEATRKIKRYAGESLGRYKGLVDSDPARAQQTLFTNLFKAEADEKLSFEEIRNEAEVYIIGGSDTTSNSMTYLVWSVCRRPHVQAALVKELQTLPEGFDETHLKELPYLNQVINETLRLYSAAPSGLPRLVPPGGADIAGHRLDGGTVVCAQAYTLHRDPVSFPKPQEFDPSRWASPTKAMKDAFMPFGRGGRVGLENIADLGVVCIGMHLAQIELRLATARFYLAFPDAKVSGLEGMMDDDMTNVIHFLLVPKGKRCLVQAACVTAE
ncbi:Cytochrome P450 [Tolypocladium paradoxum]|uniref:Cytochrome P450 n=1 Tax=Tolypocladium paradoxum TaxID=94208 RepID=A0A2S4KNV4_9HYPO|nr:Cytochrome P450 [Tolypocladium paradoxum]